MSALFRRLTPHVQNAWHALEPLVDHLIALALSIFHLGICLRFVRYGFSYEADGLQLKTALDIAEGGVVFRDTWSQYGVLTHYLHAGALLLLGKNLLSIKYYTCAIYGLMTYAQYFVLRRFVPRVLAVVIALAWISVAPHYAHAIIPWPHVDSVFYHLLSLLCVFQFVDGKGARYLVLAGALTGLSWASKQSVGAYHLLALLAFLILAYLLPGGKPADLIHLGFWQNVWVTLKTKVAPLLLGFGSVVAVVLLSLAWAGALHDWWAQTIVFPRAYYLSH